MWLLNSIFKKSTVTNVTQESYSKPLNDDSPITEPTTGNIKLWQHQKAMLNKCLYIENENKLITTKPANIDRYNDKTNAQAMEVCLGIMNDPPGCGKTYVMLALMAMDKKETTNIIIVPPNLHHQWVEAAKVYLPKSFKYKTMTEYSEVLNLFNKQSAAKEFRGVRLVITTTMYIDAVSEGLRFAEIDVDRVIVDEIDTVIKDFNNIPKSKRVWFMSASFDPCSNKKIGAFDMSGLTNEEIGQMVCRCDPTFMQKHQGKLEDPMINLVRISDGEISLFLDILSVEKIKLLNTLNIKTVKSKILLDSVEINTIMDLAHAYLKEMEERLEKLEETLIMYKEEEFPQNDIDGLTFIINKLKKQRDLLSGRIEAYNPKVAVPTKLDEINKVIDDIASNSEFKKTIFFSDDDAIFDIIEVELNKKSVRYVTLANGNKSRNDEALDKYRNDPDVKVLFLNSMRDGSGLNLENTTHIVFLHNTNPKMIEQVIGRAQRPGRTCQLNIICLYHENEI